MKLKLFHLVALLSLASLLLSACATPAPDQNFVICPKNPSTSQQTACRPDDPKNPPSIDEVRVPAAVNTENQALVIVPLKTEGRYEIVLDNVATTHSKAQALVIPTSQQRLRTDSDPNGTFCQGENKLAPLCLPHMKASLEYVGKDGVKRLVDAEISFEMTFAAVVDPETAPIWAKVDRSTKTTWYSHVSDLWDVFRIPKTIDITESGVDPIVDSGGTKTQQAVAEALNKRFESWPKKSTVNSAGVKIKSLTGIPGTGNSQGVGGNSGVGTQNLDVLSQQGLAQEKNAQNFKKEVEVICGPRWQDNWQACVEMMRIYKGQPQANYIMPTPIPPITPSPTK